jgi:hypothetical protein
VIEGRLPAEHGWVRFSVGGRTARVQEVCDPEPEQLKYREVGYLVGDRLVSASQRKLASFKSETERVHLIEPGLDRFVRVSAGRVSEDGPLVYIQQEMPLGPEFEVQTAFLDGKDTLADIREVSPALDVAFTLERWRRLEAERRRRELAERLQREEEERQRETRRREIAEQLGDGAGRRALAQEDFGTAARAALAVGEAEYLDHRQAPRRNEMVVRFRMGGRRYECTCDARTLQIIDAGICLTAHYDDTDFAGGTRGDAWLSLESLPPVIRQAEREGRLVVFRHVG